MNAGITIATRGRRPWSALGRYSVENTKRETMYAQTMSPYDAEQRVDEDDVREDRLEADDGDQQEHEVDPRADPREVVQEPWLALLRRRPSRQTVWRRSPAPTR